MCPQGDNGVNPAYIPGALVWRKGLVWRKRLAIRRRLVYMEMLE